MKPRVAYLVNQYPKTSHSFVRREILALEKLGWEIERYSIRAVNEPLVDAADEAERARTTVVLARGGAALALATFATALTSPVRFARALASTLGLARRSERGLVAPLAWLAEACWLRRRLARSNVAHLHAHFGTNPAAVAMLCRELGGPPYSFTAHGTESFDSPQTISLDRKIAGARFVVAVSEWGRAQLMRWADRTRWNDLHVVGCGVDEQFLAQAPTPPPADARLVCVARISPEKGIDVLVEALAEVGRSGAPFELALVGDGELKAELQERATKAGVNGSIRWLGWGDAAKVREQVLAARALVVPSLAEGLPVVIMEALALRRPVVATAVGAIPELVETGRTGWLTPPGSSTALAVAIRAALAATPGELARLGEAGAARVRERHDASQQAVKLAELFERSAAQERSR